MSDELEGRGVYRCTICEGTEQVVADWEPDLAVCTGCWFGFLNGAEKRAIAERIGAPLKEREVVV